MSSIKEIIYRKGIFKDRPKGLLYHYTSQEGLLGILKTKCIWASSILYLNDSCEFNYGLNKFKLELYRNDKLFHKKGCISINEIANLLDLAIKNHHIFVFSLSEEDDKLSQWRGYSSNTSGFSLGFKPQILCPPRNKEGFTLVRCIYNEDIQNKIIKECIRFLSTIKIEQTKYLWQSRLHQEIVSLIQYICPIFKHPSFIEEKEWRLIQSSVPPFDSELYIDLKVNFRPGKSMLIPYFEFPLLFSYENPPFERIVVGPTPNTMLSRFSVESLLSKYRIQNCTVNNSKCTYRTW